MSPATTRKRGWAVKNQELNDLQFLALGYHTTTIRKVIADDSAENRDLDAEFAEMDAAHATVSLLQGWISTPSWNTSQAFLAGHPPLHGPEAVLAGSHPLAAEDPDRRGNLIGIELRIEKVHIEESLLLAGHADRIDPEKWRPLIMSFCQFFGLGPILHSSRLAEIPESAYRPAARTAALPATLLHSAA